MFVISRQKEELIKELSKSDKEAKETKKQFSEKIKSMKQELEKAKREVEESKKTLEEYENKANYEVAEKQKVELEYKKKLQAMETKLQALKRKQKVWVEFKYLCCNNRLNKHKNNKGVNNVILKRILSPNLGNFNHKGLGGVAQIKAYLYLLH